MASFTSINPHSKSLSTPYFLALHHSEPTVSNQYRTHSTYLKSSSSLLVAPRSFFPLFNMVITKRDFFWVGAASYQKDCSKTQHTQHVKEPSELYYLLEGFLLKLAFSLKYLFSSWRIGHCNLKNDTGQKGAFKPFIHLSVFLIYQPANFFSFVLYNLPVLKDLSSPVFLV